MGKVGRLLGDEEERAPQCMEEEEVGEEDG